jgi:hypothetical protein
VPLRILTPFDCSLNWCYTTAFAHAFARLYAGTIKDPEGRRISLAYSLVRRQVICYWARLPYSNSTTRACLSVSPLFYSYFILNAMRHSQLTRCVQCTRCLRIDTMRAILSIDAMPSNWRNARTAFTSTRLCFDTPLLRLYYTSKRLRYWTWKFYGMKWTLSKSSLQYCTSSQRA